jgi:hypothetical protein
VTYSSQTPEYRRAWRKTRANDLRAKKRAYYLMRMHGITVEEFERMSESQSGLCLICGKPPKGGTPHSLPLQVDHDHTTGRIRGLLCAHCNTMLGWFETNQEAIEALLGA